MFGVAALVGVALTNAQQHNHNHDDHAKSIERPRVFLDKSPRVVWYQLNRLSNERLMLVERTTDDSKYVPVWEAILLRPGISRQDKKNAVDALVKLNKSDEVHQLLAALAKIDPKSKEQLRVSRQLSAMLLGIKTPALLATIAQLQEAVASENQPLQSAGFAAIAHCGRNDLAWQLAEQTESRRLAFLKAIPLMPETKTRADLRDECIESLAESHSPSVRNAAITALSNIPVELQESFRIVAQFIGNQQLEPAAIKMLLRVPEKFRAKTDAERLVPILVEKGEKTPAAKRTTVAFLDAMQLADELLAKLDVEQARKYRQRLRAIVVRVVRIHTIEEEMRYDTPFFAVEAARPVQVVLQNDDLMPHNLVITVPGAIREVAESALTLTPDQTLDGKQFVPLSEKVLFATSMVPSGRFESLTFTAPTKPGEYPFVCTFPRHWMRMYGVMVVVEDLDAWLKSPKPPADPLGSNRSFVKSWKPEDLSDGLASGVQGRTAEIGARLYKEATCAECHKMNGVGGAVGPELTEVLTRWKGDHFGVLQEILDPSYKVDPKFAVHVVVTFAGEVVSGIVVSEDKNSVTLVANPEAPKPRTIKRSDIEEMQKTSTSLMPKGLMDRYTRDEILEILAYITSSGKP